jgi:hypothetical protein
VSIESGVAVVNYEKNMLADPSATRRCPTGAIVWLEGAQFVASPLCRAEPALTGSDRV